MDLPNNRSSAALWFLINHIVLPPRLPQEDDRNAAVEQELLNFSLLALKDLQEHVNSAHFNTVEAAVTTIENLRGSRDNGIVTRGRTQAALTQLLHDKPDGYVPLEIKRQNAAVIVSQCKNGVNFEFFELSPTNVAVMGTKGRLLRKFPAAAANIASATVQNPAVVSSLARTIGTLAAQKVPEMQPKVLKNKDELEEDRDTTKPDMVTDWLLHHVAALGETIDVQQITKSTREDVLWDHCQSPWRRSPLWLLVRVSLQLLFTRAAADMDPPDSLYKAFMIYLLLRLLQMAKSDLLYLGSESVYIISAKLCRRLRKFEQLKQADCLLPSWSVRVIDIIQDSHTLLNNSWENFAKTTQPQIDLNILRQLRPTTDLDMNLRDLDLFVSQATSRERDTALTSFNPTSQYPTYAAYELPSLSFDHGECKQFRLAALEMWVECHLSSWIALNMQSTDTCGKLRRLMQSFLSAASNIYDGIPISLSIMYLTLLELWVACDISACSIYPMIKNYSPEVFLDECQCLVLPLKSQMGRLVKVELYVSSRRNAAIRRDISVFRDFGHPKSFGVVYYNQSLELQDLHAQIEHEASEKQRLKQEELVRVQREYKELMDQYNDPRAKCDTYEHLYDVYHGYTRTVHCHWCRKCAHLDQANAKSIDIYEWPLSSDPLKAKATVFELNVPQAYSDWRDACAFVISEVLGFRDKLNARPSNIETLDNHHGLSHILSTKYYDQRIILLSTVKSHTNTHRRGILGVQHLKDKDVCLKNALRYEYYDTSLGVCNPRPQSTQGIPKRCLYSMPDRSKALEKFMYKPPSAVDGPAPNEIVANLMDCPSHFSIDEFKAFAALPYGHKIIYSSTLTQLAMPAIDFGKAETESLILQIIHQTGPPLTGRIERASHYVLREESLGHAILDHLKLAMERVAKNWESWRSVASFIRLAQRVLSMTSTPEIREYSLEFLDCARNLCLKWLRGLKERASLSTDEAQRAELRSRMAEIALICASTCDIEHDMIEELLLQSSTVSSLLQSSIIVQENIGAIQTDDEKLLSILLQAWRSMMYRISRPLLASILKDGTGINAAVLANWAAFQPCISAHWTVLDDARKHWVEIRSDTLPVYFNILTAELLVNGLPIARLPHDYTIHAMYKPLFHGSSLEVAPTSEPGLKFSAASTYHGFKLHFGLSGHDMLLVAIAGNTRWDLIPPRLFADQLPVAFVNDFVHWYNHTSGEVVFRPRKTPWTMSNDMWRLQKIDGKWRLLKNEYSIIGIDSTTAKSLSKMFHRLEDRQHIHIVLNSVSLDVQIILPRLQLDFIYHARDSEIHSCQFRGMVLDTDQAIGTLVGLSSMLVLKCTRRIQDRLILIPVPRKSELAAISYTKVDGSQHVHVSIDKGSVSKVYAYALDNTLKRILDVGNLNSKLHIAYLHALTSHCLPDPFTGCTGTEVALNILRSAAVRSYGHLGPEDAALLQQIAALSPSRCFYPIHLKEMHTIMWDKELPTLSQHPGFRSYARDIVKEAQKMRLFRPADHLNTLDWGSSNDHLESRERIRSSTYRTCSYGAEDFTRNEDSFYKSRDKWTSSAKGSRAYEAAKLVIRDLPALSHSIPDLKSGVLGSHFTKAHVTGPIGHIKISSLRFGTEWMGEFSTILKDNWCDLHNVLSREGVNSNRFDIAAWLSALAYNTSADMTAIQALAGFYNLGDLSAIRPPAASSFDLIQGDKFKQHEIQVIAQDQLKAFEDSAEARIPREGTENNKQHHDRIRKLFQQRCSRAIQAFVSALQHQWPCMEPSTPRMPEVDAYLEAFSAMPYVSAKFKTWYENRLFLDYLGRVSTRLAQQPVVSVAMFQHAILQPMEKRAVGDRARFLSVENVLQIRLPDSLSTTLPAPSEPEVLVDAQARSATQATMINRLKKLCKSLHAQARSTCEKGYVSNLAASCTSLELQNAGLDNLSLTLSDLALDQFQTYLANCETYLIRLNKTLLDIVQKKSSTSDQLALLVQHSPRISPIFWLMQLNRDRFTSLSATWKTAIIKYGLAITQFHRAQRLATVSTKPVELVEELRHVGHSNWDPGERPETLLLEAESRIIFRKEQEFIASQMRNPVDDENITLQLLMGAGKSSTIVPELVVWFTDKQTLVRVIVAKPQSKQMLQILINRLGGMLNRRIYHMPFSRNIRLNITDAISLREIYQDCIQNRGVLLVQPEHLLSFKLMGIECLLNGERKLAEHLLEMQRFFDKMSRDIVDESDLIFSPKFELIYTMGSQQPIEYAPERWLIIQDILGLLPSVGAQVKHIHPQGIEIGNKEDGKFPRIRILNAEAAKCLLTHVARHIVDFGVVGLPTRSQTPNIRDALFRYITEINVRAEDTYTVEKSKFWNDLTRFPLLLVRGLIAGGVLRFVLSTKRWRVNFGLDPLRVPSTSLAVPYRSKDSPSPRSEFSHPDVVIILSLLSYYYGGLSDEELFDAFGHLSKTSQANTYYDEWVRTATTTLPTAFQQFSGVNIRDRRQCVVELFPALRYSKKAVDYYLSSLVFPKEMKQFPEKLSGSGWDLGAAKAYPTCGFSGTNDTHHLLPIDVHHVDLPSQNHTNALVLGYLTKDETSVQLLPTRTTGSDADHLLTFIEALKLEVRVMLDCGAAILEQNNYEVAQTWLRLRSDEIQAAVFFNDEELSVLDRTGRVEAFQTSPFANQLDVCVIYLDEAHTRGTDLRLPRHYRAVVTLGAQVTKDTLTQACMRMRQLGKGQAITFIVPDEIATKIRERTRMSPGAAIDVNDVLCWSIRETWDDLKRSMPLWAVQGNRYESHKDLLHGADTTDTQAEAFLEEEARTIEERYRPRTRDQAKVAMMEGWDMTNEKIVNIMARCRDFEAMDFSAANLTEEQERELAPEIEEERQIERPPRMTPEEHKLHPAIVQLASTGNFRETNSAFCPAFVLLDSTSVAQLFDLRKLPSDLYATVDYIRTVKPPAKTARASFVSDSYQRPVQWLMSITGSDDTIRYLIILSPFEANALSDKIRVCAKVTLHLFAPQFNSNFVSLDQLTLHSVGRAFRPGSVPRSLTVQLNLFAGSLYLRSFAEYKELCDFLGLLQGTAQEGQQVYADGFIEPPTGTWGLTESPVPFLRTLLMKIRREGEGIQKTHLGKVLSGERLEEIDFYK